MTDLDSRLDECFGIVFPDLDIDARRRLVRGESTEWDSLASINLLTVIEEVFEVGVDDDTADRFNSYDTIRAELAALV